MNEPVLVYRVKVASDGGAQRFEVRRVEDDALIGYDTHLPDPEPTPEEAARASAVAKLQALGLTEAEVIALAGG
jgi:hypothetical protein